jgi:Uma2 family endonuclease
VNVVAAERPRARISVERYQRMVAAGVLSKDDRIELIEGDLLTMAPIGSRHAALSMRLTKLFVRGVGDAAEVSVAGPIRLGDFSEPQPDLSLLRPRTDYVSRIPEPCDVVLAVEISDSTLAFDQTTKLALYARHGIIEYWVLDVEGSRILMYRSPVGTTYAEKLEISGTSVASPRALPELQIAVNHLFDQAYPHAPQ